MRKMLLKRATSGKRPWSSGFYLKKKAELKVKLRELGKHPALSSSSSEEGGAEGSGSLPPAG